MSLSEDLDQAAAGLGEVPVEKFEKVKLENRNLKTRTGRLEKQIADLEEFVDQLVTIDEAKLEVPKWTLPKANKNHSKAIATLMISDCHFDEVVNPDEIEGLNAYNREIAQQRLKRSFEKTILMTDRYFTGFDYEGLNLFLGGDMVTGTLHDLAETNEAHLPETVLFWSEELSAGIEMMVERFGKVHVSGVVGNHGRLTLKPRTKGRVRDNVDWLIYKLLEREFRSDDRVTFQIPESADCMVPIYNTTYRLTHGDQFRGGNGIAGIATAMVRGDARKRKLSMDTGRHYDVLVMGHFHQLTHYKSIIVNGANKGYDEYAYLNGFEFEPPQQAFWVTTPTNAIVCNAPILTMDRKKEKW